MVRATQHALSLESRAQKPWQKGILKPKRWYILPYLSAGIAATIAAGVFIASNRPPQVILLLWPYFRQFRCIIVRYNYLIIFMVTNDAAPLNRKKA